MMVVLDPGNLEGIHLVNITALRPHVDFHQATFASLNPNIPTGDPNGLLKDTGNDPKPGVYVWLDKGGKFRFNKKRVYFPGNVYSIADPLGKLRETNRGGKLFYGNLRDLAERFILSKNSPEEYERLQINPEMTRYEQNIQDFLSKIIEKGDTRDEAIEEGRRRPRLAPKPKTEENNELLAYVQTLVGIPMDPGIQEDDLGMVDQQIGGQDATQQLRELEGFMGPLDDISENDVLSTLSQEPDENFSVISLGYDTDQEQENDFFEESDELFDEGGARSYLMESDTEEPKAPPFGSLDQVAAQYGGGSQDEIMGGEAQEQRIDVSEHEDFDEVFQQENSASLPRDQTVVSTGGSIINEPIIDATAENLLNNIESPQLSMYTDEELLFGNPYSYAATSTRRDIDLRRRIPLMEDDFVDPDQLVEPADRSQNRQSISESDDNEQFEVGPGRRRWPPSRLASGT
ncbi:hypothetical protein TWF718_001088 [Orbilia javanica]|uniref:Uncharacterized protein n=1 Tax=Orbilia javanica TaxID=47235 RepID=A0AAN8RS61_9PEZI